MYVLNKLTKQERKNLVRLFKDRAFRFSLSLTFFKARTGRIDFNFNEDVGDTRKFKSLLGLFYYLVSWGSLNNKKFNLTIFCIDSITFNKELKSAKPNTDSIDIIANSVLLFHEIEVNKNETVFTKNNLLFLDKLSLLSFYPKVHLQVAFTDGYFGDDTLEEYYKKIRVQTYVETEKCVVCLENEPDVAYFECKHKCVCSNCFHSVGFEKINSTICPLCRKENKYILIDNK